jgi:hypothetical protein
MKVMLAVGGRVYVGWVELMAGGRVDGGWPSSWQVVEFVAGGRVDGAWLGGWRVVEFPRLRDVVSTSGVTLYRVGGTAI